MKAWKRQYWINSCRPSVVSKASRGYALHAIDLLRVGGSFFNDLFCSYYLLRRSDGCEPGTEKCHVSDFGSSLDDDYELKSVFCKIGMISSE